MYDPSGDTLSLFSRESKASAAPSVYTKYSKGSKWSHAKPDPLSTDVPSTTKDQSSNTSTVDTRNQATQYETQAGGGCTSLAAARVTHQPSTSPTTEATAAAANQLDVMPSLQQAVDQGVAQQPVSTVAQTSISADQRRDDQMCSQVQAIEFAEQPSPAATRPITTPAAPHNTPSSLRSEAERERAYQPSSTGEQTSIAVLQPAEDGSMPQEPGQRLTPNNMQAQFRSNQQADSRNNQPSSTVTQTSVQADQPADDNSSLTSARQPDSSHLLQSTEVQQPADMSASLNDRQGDNQPSSTIPLQSLEDAQQPHDDMGSI